MDAETLGAALALAKKKLVVDPSVIEEKVGDWLDDHPEATTTVQDGSITYSKLHSDLKDAVDEVAEHSDEIGELKSALYDEGNILNLKEYASNNNTAVTDNGDGTYTFGTNDYGGTVWATSFAVPAGTYTLQGLPQGATKSAVFVSTDTTYANRIESNTSENDKTFTNPTSQVLYYGVRSTGKPTNNYTFEPQLIATVSEIKKLNERIDETNAHFTQEDNTIKDYIRNGNLFCVEKGTNGYISSSGEMTGPTSANELTSDYIQAESGSKILTQAWVTVSGNKTIWIGVCYYQSDKTFISRDVYQGSSEESYALYLVTLPANTKYIRVSYRRYNDGKIMVTHGSFDADYIPCVEDIALKNDVDDTKSESNVIIDGIQESTGNRIYSDFRDGYIATNTSEIDVTSVLPDPDFKHIVISCMPNDRYYIKGHSGQSIIKSLWAFIDSSGNKLDASGVVQHNNYVPIVAPSSTSKLVANIDVNHPYGLIKDVPLKDEVTSIKNSIKSGTGLSNSLLRPASPKFVMHRGDNTLAPENTVPAFTLAGQAGAWGIETDVYETTDGVFILSHDDDVSRMTDGTGKITEMTYAQTQECTIDAGSNIEDYPNLKMPTLEEYLTICRRYGCVACIEIKGVTNYNSLVSTVENAGMIGSCVFLFYYDATEIATMRLLTSAPIALLASTSEGLTNLYSVAPLYSDTWIAVY